jgi:hypothetical protein
LAKRFQKNLLVHCIYFLGTKDFIFRITKFRNLFLNSLFKSEKNI